MLWINRTIFLKAFPVCATTFKQHLKGISSYVMIAKSLGGILVFK